MLVLCLLETRWSHQTSIGQGRPLHRVFLDKMQLLFVTLTYLRPGRFVQLLSRKSILILVFQFLVSIDLEHNGFYARLGERS